MAHDESLEIIDLDTLDITEDEETWLVATGSSSATQGSTWRKWDMSTDPEVRMKKRSLVEKLDHISRSPIKISTPKNYGSGSRFESRPSFQPDLDESWKYSTFTKKKPSKFETSETDLALDEVQNLARMQEESEFLFTISKVKKSRQIDVLFHNLVYEVWNLTNFSSEITI